jgi:hypothetical protein
MTKAMEAILAWRFSPLNFSVVPSFPNLVPPPSEWMDYLLVFKEEKEDNPSQHLVTFHQCMDQLGILHEDVLMKMFMYSLKGDAREWYFSLPASSICSLRDFHVAFNKHCKRYYSADILLEYCCEQFESCNQQTVECFSCDELYEDLVEKEIKEELVLVEEISNSSIQEELETKKKSDVEDDNLAETNDDEPLKILMYTQIVLLKIMNKYFSFLLEMLSSRFKISSSLKMISLSQKKKRSTMKRVHFLLMDHMETHN